MLIRGRMRLVSLLEEMGTAKYPQQKYVKSVWVRVKIDDVISSFNVSAANYALTLACWEKMPISSFKQPFRQGSTRTHARAHTHTHAHTRTHTHAHARTRTHTHAHARTRTHTHAHTRTRTHTHTHTRTHAHTHTRAHTHTKTVPIPVSAIYYRDGGWQSNTRTILSSSQL